MKNFKTKNQSSCHSFDYLLLFFCKTMQGSELHKAIRKPQILVFGAFISDICIYVKSNSCVSFFNIHCMQLYVRKNERSETFKLQCPRLGSDRHWKVFCRVKVSFFSSAATSRGSVSIRSFESINRSNE